MFRTIVTLVCLATSVAFRPVARSVRSTSLQMSFDVKKQIGAQAPLGFFDPLGLLKDADEETFNLYRSIETKHGRVAMYL